MPVVLPLIAAGVAAFAVWDVMKKVRTGLPGTSGASSMLALPTGTNRVTSGYDPGRIDPVNPKKGVVPHYGIDFGVPVGTPVYACCDAVVSYAGTSTSYPGNGNFILLTDTHTGRSKILYLHLSQFAVSSGQKVSKGQVIGSSGNTGYTTGPHLHFEWHVDNVPVNPISDIYPPGTFVSASTGQVLTS